MRKVYIVRLTKRERVELQAVVKKLKKLSQNQSCGWERVSVKCGATKEGPRHGTEAIASQAARHDLGDQRRPLGSD